MPNAKTLTAYNNMNRRDESYILLLYLSVSTRAVIDQLIKTGQILLYGRPKFKAVSVAKMFVINRQVFLNFCDQLKFKTSFTPEIVYLNLLNNDIKLTRFAFEVRQKFEAFPRK